MHNFLSKERSYQVRLGPEGSKWRLKLENTRRKNAIDTFASREFLRDETMVTYKSSVGLSYNDMQEKQYRKLDLEVALPMGGDSVGYIKADGFIVRTHPIVEKKLNFVWQVQGGVMRSCFGKPRTAINDRFYLSSSMGFSHLNKRFQSNQPDYWIDR